MRGFVRHVVESLRHDTHWETDKYRLTNRRLGFAVWIANGFWFLHFEYAPKLSDFGIKRENLYLTLYEKFVVWLAVRKMHRLSVQRRQAEVLSTIVSRRLASQEEI